MTNNDKRQDKNNQDGGVLPKSKKSTASERVSKALSKPKQGAIQKPTRADSAESMSISPEQEDIEMQLLRRGLRYRAKPNTFTPALIATTKSRGPLTEEQKASRKAARLAKKEALPVVPDQEALDAARKEQAIAVRAQEILAQQMELDSKRPSRAAKSKVETERKQAEAYAQAKKELAGEKKVEKKAMTSAVDELADLLGMMSTARPAAPVQATPTVLGMHSSGHPIVGYTPEGWPLGLNPATGQVEPFSTAMGGKKKRTNKKKAQKGGEVEGAVAEDGKSQPAPVSGGKKKRTNKKKAQKGGEVEGAVAENAESQPAPVSGGKKKRNYKKK